MRVILLSAVACLTVGCRKTPAVCVTEGATYLVSFDEISGNCGPIPSQIMNVPQSGLAPVPQGVTCESSNVQGCTIQNTNCAWQANGHALKATTDITFHDDGASASGLMTASVDGQCISTYRVSYVRQ